VPLTGKGAAMTEERYEWLICGDCVEACTSPPVCPANWFSPPQAQFHSGHSCCETCFNFHITQGYYASLDLADLSVIFAVNLPDPFPPKGRVDWPWVLFIDERADAEQTKALESIFRTVWRNRGNPLAVKKAKIEFRKELLDGGLLTRYTVRGEGFYHLETRPLGTRDGRPMYFSSIYGGHMYIGVSEVNEFDDPDLPRGHWNAPNMNVTYWDFVIHSQKPHWVPAG